jgi:SEC-C motif
VAWYEQVPTRWAADQEIAHQFLSDVESGLDSSGRAFICGTYVLSLNCGHELDRFRLQILYPPEFLSRNCHPVVYLQSHRDRWQPGGDSHIERSWRLCLFVPLESGLNFERSNELEHLFPHIHTFLLRERIYQRDLRRSMAEASWPGPDRAHGSAGLLEAIRASRTKIGRNDPCVCGSGKKYKKCCQERIAAAVWRRQRGGV